MSVSTVERILRPPLPVKDPTSGKLKEPTSAYAKALLLAEGLLPCTIITDTKRD